MSCAQDSSASRLQGPYAGLLGKPLGKTGYTVTSFPELPFAEAGYHRVFAEGDAFWRHPAVAHADVLRPVSERAGPVNEVIEETSEANLHRQWTRHANPLLRNFFKALCLPVKFRVNEEIDNLPEWRDINVRYRSRPDIG